MTRDYEQLRKDAIRVVSDDAVIVSARRRESKLDVTEKGRSDFVSDADVASEEYLKSALSAITPGCAFFTEESCRDVSDLTWLIDPIDGTTNYIHGCQNYAISAGLLERDGDTFHPVVGVVVLPDMHMCLSSAYGGSAMLSTSPCTYDDEHPIHVAETNDDDMSVISFGWDVSPCFPVGTLEAMSARFAGMKVMGPASFDICMVAMGMTDGYFEVIKPWDYCAAALILQNAGGILSDWDGDVPDFLRTNRIMAASPGMRARLLETTSAAR